MISTELKLGIWLSGLQGWIKDLSYLYSKCGELGTKEAVSVSTRKEQENRDLLL